MACRPTSSRCTRSARGGRGGGWRAVAFRGLRGRPEHDADRLAVRRSRARPRMKIDPSPTANSPGCSATGRCAYPRSFNRSMSCRSVRAWPRRSSSGRAKTRGNVRCPRAVQAIVEQLCEANVVVAGEETGEDERHRHRQRGEADPALPPEGLALVSSRRAVCRSCFVSNRPLTEPPASATRRRANASRDRSVAVRQAFGRAPDRTG